MYYIVTQDWAKQKQTNTKTTQNTTFSLPCCLKCNKAECMGYPVHSFGTSLGGGIEGDVEHVYARPQMTVSTANVLAK